ncbi:MAG: galactokinase [Balneolaceae bacterium]|nr:galactokinase [Balneolaceae bacterium]
MKPLVQEVGQVFQQHFGKEYKIILSPGRINLIGEHTDYNNGYVLPAAVDKYIVLAMQPNNLNQLRFKALDMDDHFEKDLAFPLQQSQKRWANYLLGVIDQLQEKRYTIQGFDCVFGGNIPIGAGMSSSAALEAGIVYGLNVLFDLGLSTMDMVRIAQNAENQFVGVQCGIMDQFACMFGKQHHAIRLDCQTLKHQYIPLLDEDIRVVICDTGVRRELASSEYNIRREQCEEGVQVLKKYHPEVCSLRDITLDLLIEHHADLDPVVFKRCRYVIEENDRVLQACEHLRNNDFPSFGDLMFRSHKGLQEEYEVSCPELNILVEIAKNIEGIIGSRMMGGGFGGCTINLVKEEQLHPFIQQIENKYRKKTGLDANVYVTMISEGTKTLHHAFGKEK